jgi:hypothetical protein
MVLLLPLVRSGTGDLMVSSGTEIKLDKMTEVGE